MTSGFRAAATVMPWLRPRLRVPEAPGEALRIERVIAASRLILTAVAFVQLDRPSIFPPEERLPLQVFLLLTAAHGIAALWVLRQRQRTTHAFAIVTHGFDLMSAVALMPIAAPPSPFFVFYLFVLVAAAFRWGLRETVATNLVAVGLIAAHAQLSHWFPALGFGGVYDLEGVMLRTGYLSMIGLLLGYLAEEGRLLRTETSALAGMLSEVRADVGIARVLTSVAEKVQTLCNASAVMLAVENRSTGRAFRWDSTGGSSATPVNLAVPPLTFAAAHKWWRSGGPSAYRIVGLDANGRRREMRDVALPPTFLSSYPFLRLISVPVSFGDEWTGRAFVFDPTVNVRLLSLAEFLQKLVRQLTPAALSVYLLGELRTRAGAIERARVAREIHDGVIQSLVGVEMRIAALRSQSALAGTPAAEELQRLQHMLRDEVLNLRDLMSQMRSPELDPSELVDYLAQLVDRFGRDSGITARFSSDLKEVVLSRQVCFELVRIVQEGLVNIRKHSGATSVVVRLGRSERLWVLEIDDNGQGFPFDGTMSLQQLDEGRRGPIVIKERVRAIGGQLTLESIPNRGTRLRVLVPQEEYA